MDNEFNYKKAFVFATLATIGIKTDEIDCSQNSLIAVTSAGIITGTYVSNEVKETLKDDLTYLTFENISTIANESCENADNAILLKNAVLTTSQGIKNHFSFCSLFFPLRVSLLLLFFHSSWCSSFSLFILLSPCYNCITRRPCLEYM